MRLLNTNAWAVGKVLPSGFRARRIFWGRLLARAEKQPGEAIKPVTIVIREAVHGKEASR
jgi:hypothetical protein